MASCNNLNGAVSLGCDNNVGGVYRMYFIEKSLVTATGLSSPSGEISSFTISGSPAGKFYEFAFNKNTSSYVEEGTTDQATGRDLFTQTITLVLNRREKTKRDALLLLARRKNLVAIVTDNNLVNWYLGETFGLNLTTNTGGSGTTKTDANQYVITLVAEEPSPANTVTDAAVTAHTIAAS